MSLNLHIVTPARNMLSTACEDVVLPGFDGEMAVLEQHAFFVNKLGAGIVTIHKTEGVEKLAISGGVVEIGGNQITVLADDAVFAKEVNTIKLADQQKIVDEKLVTLSENSSDREKLFDQKKWITAQLQLVQEK